MAKNQLIEIPQADWPRLRDLYRPDWPKNFTSYYTLDTFLRWSQQKSPVQHMVVYSLNGDWAEDGTYVCIHRYQLFANTLSASVERLQIALSLVDWSRGYEVSTVSAGVRPPVLSVLKEHQFSIDFDDETYLYYMGKDQALQLNVTCPPDITLKSLGVEHVQEITESWSNRQQGAGFLIRQIIELSPSLGAFDENGHLVAWCMRFTTGLIGALKVLETHERRGLGTLVCTAFVKKLAEMGFDSGTCVEVNNVASKKLFEKIGFRVIEKTCWIRNNPTTSEEWTD